MDKFKNKYRIPSARLQHWNYGAMGSYFVTICTKNMNHFFGEIISGEMLLNEIGKTVESEWIRSIELRQDMKLELGAFVVMPNHFHGIVIIGENEFNSECRDAIHCVSTATSTMANNKFGPQSKNLSSIIRGFKSSVTTYAKKIGCLDFQWQPRFYDHIIRDTKSFESIQHYILSNPMNWNKDEFHIG